MKTFSEKSLLAEFKENYYAYVPLTIILQSCIGSIAAMLILAQGTSVLTFIELLVCVSLAMGYNAALLAGAPYKLSFRLLGASIIVNILLIFINLI
ncbi:hypothetical protein [Marixanthomonas spongiae]|uniref:Uncharacterized protein n=1 Tax=Marixanthomonas spongiae TaxID=2174845 RepID=A0A2U0HYF1_9FLAO|nr:hypothetical protein [Marixanthomonas spongiae]PVW13885.1 hypothetical protein DDV96_12085 [Marixanthomonas spongiae]